MRTSCSLLFFSDGKLQVVLGMLQCKGERKRNVRNVRRCVGGRESRLVLKSGASR